MRILYYDCFSGISGDMNLGAMIDLGVDKDYLIGELSKLKLSGYNIDVSIDNRKGITGTKVKVILKSEEVHHHHNEQEHSHYHEYDHVHNHNHHHYPHEHSHNHNNIHDHNSHGEHVHSHGESVHQHRNLGDIEKIIDNSALSERVKLLSKKIFMKVAEAEAKIHGKSLMEVHFHEVGALDSIVDIIGAAVCLDYLKVDKVMASSVELGGGFVKCAHGMFPVPAPATAEILKGIPVKFGAVPFETTTPTGAAILSAIVDEFTDKKEFTIKKIAYGIGQRDTDIPNVLRVYLGEALGKSAYLEAAAEKSSDTFEEALILECNIDDMNPELYDYVMERLFKEGAMDAFMTPIIMKKGRPGIKLSVLCSESVEKKLAEILLLETTTLGVRKYRVEKSMLKREFSTIKTKYGEINIKSSYLNGEKIKCKPEYDDCKRIAIDNNIPMNIVYEEVYRNLNK
ncbi:nickel pincer cofactor biosynthesis protein LarC [Clostridium sp. SYSU_GA19001]|uniref:nickel pincer cofactor biosynthesis protein LarC n=1 Tax=Clostridium caldaquaticum TaxID=2940653 RepID=UPI0020772E9C|nr:nickel pincer cofactor biosynthesis protein LarC [Clostridium caldaquaticum]MCM8712036.1 nickel pincer cofactor biosynthesis protein LarC [Clostridium caldaquaticum]